jgi:tRNA(Arg) A34 adenosine deaminase TadA
MKVVNSDEAKNRALEDISRAQQARQVTNNPLVAHYFIKTKGDLLDRFSNTKHSDVDELKQIHLELQALDKFQKHFTDAITKGNIAENWFQRLAKQTKTALKR